MYQCTSPTPRLGPTPSLYNNAAVIALELYRDGIDAPWGFRLRGGIDVDGGTPLEIIKVRNCHYLLINTQYVHNSYIWVLEILIIHYKTLCLL